MHRPHHAQPQETFPQPEDSRERRSCSLREEVAVAYGLWMAILVVGLVVGGKPLLAPKYFWETIRRPRNTIGRIAS